MNTDTLMITLKDLIIGYPGRGGRKFFRCGPLNLSIREGDMVAVMGPNGAGKSSLLRTVAGLQGALGGKVMAGANDIRRCSRQQLASLISYVSTEKVSIPHMRVVEMVALGRFPHTGWLGAMNRGDWEKTEEAMEMARVGHLSQRYLHEISDGERQKVMIARALAQDTPVIILDEPTAFLDLPARHEILHLLNRLTWKDGRTILYSTHEVDIAIGESDLLWLMTGEGVYEAHPEDLHFNNVFHKLFLNSPFEADEHAGLVRPRKKLDRKLCLTGEGKYRELTASALLRAGFEASSEKTGDMELNVTVGGNQAAWELKTGGETVGFPKLYDLVRHLKKIQTTHFNLNRR